jgi:hypothetical protein
METGEHGVGAAAIRATGEPFKHSDVMKPRQFAVRRAIILPSAKNLATLIFQRIQSGFQAEDLQPGNYLKKLFERSKN